MRLWLIIVLAIVFGGAACAAMTWFELGRTVESFESVSQSKVSTTVTTALANSDPAGPRVVVEGGPKYEFGTMAHGSTSVQTFVVRNEGKKPLAIKFDHPSCGMCIETTFVEATLEPGQKCDVPITYHARKEGPAFEESAHLTTTDPRIPELMLTLKGIVTKPVRLIPTDLTFGSVSASDGSSGVVAVLGYHSEEISLLGHKFNNESMTKSFDVVATPMPKEKILEKDKNATCGLEVRVTAKPGLPLGPISENMTLDIRAEKEHSIELPVHGEVVGDITIVGKSYVAERGVLTLGLIKQGQGHVTSLFLLVKGPHRKDLKFTVGEVIPANSLKVQIGEASTLGDGKAIRVPITVEVPKSAPAQTHMGDARGEHGKITIETTHPTVKQVPISVRFVIE